MQLINPAEMIQTVQLLNMSLYQQATPKSLKSNFGQTCMLKHGC